MLFKTLLDAGPDMIFSDRFPRTITIGSEFSDPAKSCNLRLEYPFAWFKTLIIRICIIMDNRRLNFRRTIRISGTEG